MKRLILASILFCSPVNAEMVGPGFSKGFAEGVHLGAFAAICGAYEGGRFKDQDWARDLTMEAYEKMHPSDKAWARKEWPKCFN